MAASLTPSSLFRLLGFGLLLLARAALWLLPGLFLISLALFALLARSQDNQAQLPLFVNPEPTGADVRAAALVERLREGDATQLERDQLVRGGSALLPHILPRLDTLPPDERTHVAAALLPIAERMGIIDQPIPAERAAAFWARYWSARGMDYRPAITKRAVKRLARGANPLRRAEVRELDTFALPELMGAIDSSELSDSPEALQALTRAAAHITGQAWVFATDQNAKQPPHGAALGQEEARDRWQQWWLRHRQEFEVYRGTRELGAMVEQTLYARWVLQVMSPRFWQGPESPGPRLRKGLPPTLSLLLVAWLGRLAAALLVRKRGHRLRKRRSRWWLLALSFLPPASLGVFGQRMGVSGVMAAGVLAVWYGFALRIQDSDLFGDVPAEQGAQYWPSPFWLSWTLSAVIALELALGVRGLGQQTFDALREQDLNWLMLLALGSVALTGLIDAVLRTVETERLLRLESVRPPPPDDSPPDGRPPGSFPQSEVLS